VRERVNDDFKKGFGGIQTKVEQFLKSQNQQNYKS
jgi:hypothetical protein